MPSSRWKATRPVSSVGGIWPTDDAYINTLQEGLRGRPRSGGFGEQDGAERATILPGASSRCTGAQHQSRTALAEAELGLSRTATRPRVRSTWPFPVTRLPEDMAKALAARWHQPEQRSLWLAPWAASPGWLAILATTPWTLPANCGVVNGTLELPHICRASRTMARQMEAAANCQAPDRWRRAGGEPDKPSLVGCALDHC